MADSTIELREGRLVEIRHLRGLESVADIERIARLARSAVERVPADMRVVTVADWRNCSVMSPETAERTLQMLKRANPQTERAAMLYAERSPTSVMQFVRLLRDSNHPNRRMFSDPVELVAWLAEVLTEAELRRLRAFLDEAPSLTPLA